jgi:hypothetical protein
MQRRVLVTGYSLRSWGGGSHLRNWLIEGSEDGANWVELDGREENSKLNDGDAHASFDIARQQEMRMIRLRQTGPNHWNGSTGAGGYNKIVLQAFELFGTLIESNDVG